MNVDLKLKDRNVNNTHPSELKKLVNKDFDEKIKKLEDKKSFYINSFIFFTFFSIMFYLKPIMIFVNFDVILNIIALSFSLAIIICELIIKDELINKKISNSILDSYIK